MNLATLHTWLPHRWLNRFALAPTDLARINLGAKVALNQSVSVSADVRADLYRTPGFAGFAGAASAGFAGVVLGFAGFFAGAGFAGAGATVSAGSGCCWALAGTANTAPKSSGRAICHRRWMRIGPREHP